MFSQASITYNKYVFNNPPDLSEEEFDLIKAELKKNTNFSLNKSYSQIQEEYWTNIIWQLIVVIILFWIGNVFNNKIFGIGAIFLIIGRIYETFYFIKFLIKKKTYYLSLKAKVLKAKSYYEYVALT